MTDETALALFVVLPVVLLAIAAMLTRRVDKQRDWVAERHRSITHRGFKSRAGIRS